MKKLAIALALTASTLSFQANALEAPCTTLGCKLSVQIIHDSEEYNVTGRMSEYLAAEVKELKLSAGEVSDEEAVGILVDFAHRTLELY